MTYTYLDNRPYVTLNASMGREKMYTILHELKDTVIIWKIEGWKSILYTASLKKTP